MQILRYLIPLIVLCWFSACTEKPHTCNHSDVYPSIFPDYIDVTVPVNMAPLNFQLTGFKGKAALLIQGKETKIELSSSGTFHIPQKQWKKLLLENRGSDVTCTVFAKEQTQWTQHKTFHIHISGDSIDPYMAYRLIEPGFELWNTMGIYQRNLENFDQEVIYENRMTGNNCVNCHSFCMQDPKRMLFHLRETYPGTILSIDGEIQKLNTKTTQTMSQLVYPSWHPSGKYVAFSVNNTRQGFHENNKNRVEVFDSESDVVVYDVERSEIFTSSLLFSKNAFETFPTFSPDGKVLYFCSAEAIAVPEKYDSVKYSLCSIRFDPEKKTFGEKVDTLYNALSGHRSASFPRVSPHGKYLMFTLSDYGNFSIWHKDADLKLMDLAKNEYIDMDNANSDDVESYHSWSSNSRWFVFSSRRIDGLYTRPYFAHIDEQGQISKAFLLPQKDPGYYHGCMKSYNIPELIKGKVQLDAYRVASVAKSDGIQVKFDNQ